jgi:hypothetical protein
MYKGNKQKKEEKKFVSNGGIVIIGDKYYPSVNKR